jgi:hypothetical protein
MPSKCLKMWPMGSLLQSAGAKGGIILVQDWCRTHQNLTTGFSISSDDTNFSGLKLTFTTRIQGG